MQSDKELLMLAAQAYWAGEIDDVVSIEWSDEDNGVLYTHADNQDHNGADRTLRWNSLEEGGDALPLAVKLGIDVLQRFVGGRRTEALAPGGPVIAEWHEVHGGDADAATRRAITRAAAQLAQAAQEGK